MAARISTSSAHSSPVSHAAATSQTFSQGASAGSGSAMTAAEGPTQTTPVQETPVQQTGTQQPVHYQPPSQPAGPAGLRSQVGDSCNPKCS